MKTDGGPRRDAAAAEQLEILRQENKMLKEEVERLSYELRKVAPEKKLTFGDRLSKSK